MEGGRCVQQSARPRPRSCLAGPAGLAVDCRPGAQEAGAARHGAGQAEVWPSFRSAGGARVPPPVPKHHLRHPSRLLHRRGSAQLRRGLGLQRGVEAQPPTAATSSSPRSGPPRPSGGRYRPRPVRSWPAPAPRRLPLAPRSSGFSARRSKKRGKSGIMVTHDSRMAGFTDRTISILDGVLTTR